MNLALIKRPDNIWILLSLILLAVVVVTIIDLILGTYWLNVASDNYLILFFFNLIGIALLCILIGYYGFHLLRQRRQKISGTQLTIRFLRIFAVLLLSSLSIVYAFSFLSINRGIESWFDIQVSEALREVNQLSDLFIDSVEEKMVMDLEAVVEDLAQKPSRAEIADILFAAQNAGDYEEITYFDDLTSVTGIVASSGLNTDTLVPQKPDQKFIEQALSTASTSSTSVGQIVPIEGGGARLRMLIPVIIADTDERHFLQVVSHLPLSSQRLAEKISTVNEQYQTLVYLRTPLKLNFVMTLTFVTLLVLLLAIWAAIQLTQRLVNPIHMLSKGTQEVAKGDYGRKLPVNSRDDLGILVESFNTMTVEIRDSHKKIQDSQETAERQRSYLEAVLKHLSSGVIFIDANSQLSDLNLAAEKILGLRSVEVKHCSLENAVAGNEELEPLLSMLQNGISEEKTDWNDTVKVITSDGERILNCSATRLPISDGSNHTHVVVVEDITDLVNAQRGLAWANVAERMSHELLTPLQPIRLAVDRIRLKTQKNLSAKDSESLELAYSAINRQLNSMQRIVNDFRDYRGMNKLQVKSVDVNSLVSDVVVMLSQNQRTDLFTVQLDSELQSIVADPEQLVRVLNNLLSNAIDAVSAVERPLITVLTTRTGSNSVRIRISDNGPGFRSEVLERLYQPYVSTKKKGVGLGLGIVKQIIDQHGGQISVSNQSQGGAEVIIELNSQIANGSDDQTFIGHHISGGVAVDE